MPANHYGCAANHAEFTCVTAFYVGPRKYRKKAAWCQPCLDKYGFPEDTKEEADAEGAV
jgi:hypothetical protein